MSSKLQSLSPFFSELCSVALLSLPPLLTLLYFFSSQTVLVFKTTGMSKSCRTIFQRSCRPTSEWTTLGDASSMPRWSKSSLTCAAWTKSTPSNIALCHSSLSIACSSPHWCLRCLAVRCHSKARVERSLLQPPLLTPPPLQKNIIREDDCNFHIFIYPSSSPHSRLQAPTLMLLKFCILDTQCAIKFSSIKNDIIQSTSNNSTSPTLTLKHVGQVWHPFPKIRVFVGFSTIPFNKFLHHNNHRHN